MKAYRISNQVNRNTGQAAIGVFATSDPRIDNESRQRCQNIIKLVSDKIAGKIALPSGKQVQVFYSDILVDGEKQADIVAKQFLENHVNILICVPDTWAFPQLSLLSLLSHFPKDTPLNFTCGNSAPKPGVVFTHAVSGAVAQSGRLMHINVGKWDDEGMKPEIQQSTIDNLLDWTFSAVTFKELKGKRIVVFGHDSMGMETALAHIIETRNTFGIEITRLDMKLLADMINKKAYDEDELKRLRAWIDKYAKDRIDINNKDEDKKFNQSLALYLIVRDILNDLDAVGGGFMSQLEWGSDMRGLPLPVADIMESLFNSTFDHNGEKPVMPFATEADVQGLLTQVFMTYLSGGNPPLFMDFRKVWENQDIIEISKKLNIEINEKSIWFNRGFVDGDNSGSASFNWAAKPGTSEEEIMKNISFPQVNKDYFPGGGNSVHFKSPGGISGIAARLAFSALSGMFSLIWDEAQTVELPNDLADAVMKLSDIGWPHTFITPKHATMHEYKHYAPANHFHMTWNLSVARLQFWMDLANVISATPWKEMEYGREGIDRPLPLLYILNGGENETKMKLKSIGH